MLDLSPAFDTVDNDLLVNRRRISFGVRDTALGWIDSFIRNGQTSTSSDVEFGVPQESVLGLILFLVYTPGVSSRDLPKLRQK